LYHVERLKNAKYDNIVFFTVDYAMQGIAKLMVPECKNVEVLLHGGFEPVKDTGIKDIEVLFPGTMGKLPSWGDVCPDPMPIERYFADETIKVLAEHPEFSVRKALTIVLRENGEDMTPDLIGDLTYIICYVDGYIRNQCKYNMLEALLKAGIKVHLVGNGYEELTLRYQELVVVHGPQNIDGPGGVLELMARAKVVINPCPPVFEKGMHERIFTAMLHKSICFTPYSVYAEENFGDYVELVDLNHLQEMSEKIQEILFHYSDYKERIEDNYKYALANHTWKKRGEYIVDFFEEKYRKIVSNGL
jgi:hypothetical protein